MKILLNLCSAASMVCLLAIAASDLGIVPTAAVVGKSDSGLAHKIDGRAAPKSSFAAAVIFNAHARSKVVQYFDTYRSEPYGLPPACADRMRTGQTPAEWGEPGKVVPQDERQYLIEVPIELVRVLAAQSEIKVRYYLAGNSLVGVDESYKILDAVRIPTIRLEDGRELVSNVRLVGFRR